MQGSHPRLGVSAYRARSLLAALLLAAGAGPSRLRSAQAAVCDAPNVTTFRVEFLADARQLNAAVNCTDGGQLDAVWAGAVTLDAPIIIGAGTSLSVTGEDDVAEVRGNKSVRMFDVLAGGELTLTGLKLSSGFAEEGGAIRSYMGTVILDSCIFEGNVAAPGDGGGIWAEGGKLLIFGGSFLRNEAAQFGGAVFATDAGMVAQNGTRFEENKAIEGGGVYCGGDAEGAGAAAVVAATCSFNDVEFLSNNASRETAVDFKVFEPPWTTLNGGGAATFFHADVEITDAVFTSNYAQLAGGALYGGNFSNMVIVGSSFFNNTTPGYGAGVAASSATLGGDTELRNNSADRHGGAVFAWDMTGTVNFEDVDCRQNTALDNGGCFYAAGRSVIVNGTVMRGNVANLGGCVYGNGNGDVNVDGGYFSCVSKQNGGFLFASDGARINITAGLFVNNVAARRGAAVYCSGDSFDLGGSQVFIEGGDFIDNEALELGGAVVAWGETTVVTITGGLFKGNIAKYYGGFIFLEEGASLTCEGATLEDNYAGDQGGGIYARDATWVNSSCSITGNESPQGAAAYLTHVRYATFEDLYIGDNVALGGSVVFIAETPLIAVGVTFDSGVGAGDESGDRALQMDGTSAFYGDGCVFRGWQGDTVIHSQSMDSGSLVLDSCDFRESSAIVAVVSTHSDAEIRNAAVSELTLENAVLDPLRLVDRALVCGDPNACGAGECINSSLGVLCECLHSGGGCLDDGGALSLRLQTPPGEETYSPAPVEFELLVSAGEEGTTSAIWELSFSAVDLALTVVPSSGVLPPGGSITVQVTGTPEEADVGGNLTSLFELWSAGGGDGGTTDGMELRVYSTFFLCRAFEYAVPVDDGEGSIECDACANIEGTEGVDCDTAGATLASLPVRKGFWRSDTESVVVHECIHSDACVGATTVTTADDYCSEGYLGPYCAVCGEGFGKGVGTSCHSCEDGRSRVFIAAGVLFSLVLLLLLLLAVVFLIGGLDAVGSVRRSVASSLSVTIARSKAWHGGAGGGSAHGPITEKNGGTDSSAADFAPAFEPASESDTRRGGHGASAVVAGSELEEGDDVASVKSPDTAVGVGLGLLGSLKGSGKNKSSGRLGSRTSENGAPRETDSGDMGEGDVGGEKGGCCRCGLGEKIKRLASRLPLDKLKILVVVWQILTVFPSITAVEYPPSYSRFLSWIDFVNLDLGSVLSASCVFPNVSFYDKLLITTLLPIGLIGVLVITYQAAKRRSGIGSAGVISRRAAWSRHMAAGLLLTFLVFTSASTIVFKTFACDEKAVDGASYLRADYSLSCKSDRHMFFMFYAGFMIAVYPIGIPSLYLFILWTNRHSLNPRVRVDQDLRRPPVAPGPGSCSEGTEDAANGREWALSQRDADKQREKMVERRRSNPDLVPSMFLWKDFGPDLYYYEVIECGRRMLLTGVLIFIAPYSAAQAATACIFAFASLLGFELLRPHLDPTDSWLYRLGCVVIFLSNFLALLIKVDAAGEGKRSALGGLLVAVNVGLVLAVILTSWFATQQQVDDSQDSEENLLAMAETMITADRLAAQDAAAAIQNSNHRRAAGPAAVGPAGAPLPRSREGSGMEGASREHNHEHNHAGSRTGGRAGACGHGVSNALVAEMWQRDKKKSHGGAS